MRYTTKQLIESNNSKRKQLTKENEQYYDGLLVYIRLQSQKSERATEEVLLEMLDHLLEAQKEGRAATEVFGKEPKELADEIVENLPDEAKSATVLFTIEIISILLGFFLVTRGFVQFGKEEVVHIVNLAFTVVLMVGAGGAVIWFILAMLRKDAFGDAKGRRRTFYKNSLLMALFTALLVGVAFIPDIGPEVTLPRYTSIGAGCALLLISFLLSRHRSAK